MNPFLSQVAGHYYNTGKIEKICFVFPNRRSLLFFKNYLADELRQDAVMGKARPIVAPLMFSMDDFIYRLSEKVKTDKVSLLLELYACYAEIKKSKALPLEELDEFIFWGDVILNDFDDVDKYLVNPKDLFTNISDFKNIQDSFSYLSETQRKAIERFVGHFKTGGRIKDNFVQIWDLLLPLYESFNQSLNSKSMCYEGMAYRSLAKRMDDELVADIVAKEFPYCESFVFVGLNALNNCEKLLMSKLRNAGLAEFCWDYSSEMISDSDNMSSFFMKDNIIEYPQAFKLDPDGLGLPSLKVVSVPSSIAQSKMLSKVLTDTDRIDTAIVLPDEQLLLPVLNAIPSDISDINVTMGYPAKESEFFSLISEIAALQMHIRMKEEGAYFYHKQVWAILSNSVFKAAIGKEGEEISRKIKSAAEYYVPQSSMKGHPLMEIVFSPVVKDIKSRDAASISALCASLTNIIKTLALSLKDIPQMAMEMEFAMLSYEAVSKLSKIELPVLPATFFRLLNRLLTTSSVPFKGEPLKGLQIMGPLEVRAIDFKKIIVLSCNEGVFPRHTVSSSFIPAELRRGFQLPTYEYQDAIWAYYFYRMIQRAEEVWLFTDSRMASMRTGEESRYIKQLELHFRLKVERIVAKTMLQPQELSEVIPKTAEDIEIIKNLTYSASILENYLDCPAKFYYKAVKGLKEDEQVKETVDPAMLGTIFHETMCTLYKQPSGVVTSDFIDSLLKDENWIRSLVRESICAKMKTIEVSGRNVIIEDVVVKYVLKVLERDKELLGKYGVPDFKILNNEGKFFHTICGRKFKGFIDRMDSFVPGEIRIVDYKTGSVQDKEYLIDDSNASSVVGDLFKRGEVNSRPKIALQLFIYDALIRDRKEYAGMKIFNSIYPIAELFVEPVKSAELNESFYDMAQDALSDLLEEIENPDVDFQRYGTIENSCKFCGFKTLCGR